MPVVTLRPALALAAMLAGAALFAAMASEWWGGMVPCALCLLGRWPYRLAIAAAVLGVVLPAYLARWCAGLALLAMLGSAAIAMVHVGVEAKWWPSPLPGCVARLSTGASVAEQLARLPDLPAKPCDDPSYPVASLPVSMAMMSLTFSLALAAALGAALYRPRADPQSPPAPQRSL